MEFSDMLERCNLSAIGNFLMGWDETPKKTENSDFAAAIRKMEKQTDRFLEKYFENSENRDKCFAEITSRENVIRETYFQLGFIAGISVLKDIEKRAEELK